MASIKLKFRPSTVRGNKGTIYYQIIHERKVRQLVSAYHIYCNEWDNTRSRLRCTQPSPEFIAIQQSVNSDMYRLSRIVNRLDASGIPYSSDDVVDQFNIYASRYTLFKFMRELISLLKQNGKIRTAETYVAALNSFRKFRNDQDIMLDNISSEVMEAYQAWHRNRNVTPNTISFYTRILRAVYNRAVDNDIIENRNPFRRVYTGVEKTSKRALPLKIIRKIRALDLSLTPMLDYARDMFILSFMLRGMSFVDMAYLKKTDLRNGHIVYRRRKTGQLLTIEWTGDMKSILDKYPENASDYLLPIIRKNGVSDRSSYRNTAYNINHNLKKIAVMVGVSIPLTLYVARHSWASAAKSKGIPLAVISEGMGHDSEYTTRIYLASLDTSVVDRANTVILKCLQ